jgi:hypothetical protein
VHLRLLSRALRWMLPPPKEKRKLNKVTERDTAPTLLPPCRPIQNNSNNKQTNKKKANANRRVKRNSCKQK